MLIVALGIYRLYVELDLVGTALGVILAHAVTGLPFVVLTVSGSLSNLDPRLEQAARGLGASVRQTLRYVIVPNIVPGVLSGAIFAFIHSCGIHHCRYTKYAGNDCVHFGRCEEQCPGAVSVGAALVRV